VCYNDETETSRSADYIGQEPTADYNKDVQALVGERGLTDEEVTAKGKHLSAPNRKYI
jgi:hypothetical protein